jgi:hypothetical protein
MSSGPSDLFRERLVLNCYPCFRSNLNPCSGPNPTVEACPPCHAGFPRAGHCASFRNLHNCDRPGTLFTSCRNFYL